MYKEVEFDFPCAPCWRDLEDYYNGGPNYTIREPVKTNDPDNLISIKRALSNHTRVLKQQANAIKELKYVRPYKKKVSKYVQLSYK